MEVSYVLRVIVHSCEHLLAKDLNGTSDPYVRCFVDDELAGETDVRKGDLNPGFISLLGHLCNRHGLLVWNHKFDVPLDHLPLQGSPHPVIKLLVCSKYWFGKVCFRRPP